VFTDVAQVILRGGSPYRDVWDIKPPGIYLIYTVIVGLFGPRIVAARAVDLLCQSITVALLYLLGRRLVRRDAALFGALIYAAVYLHSGYWSMAQAEGFAALPTSAALLLAQHGRHRNQFAPYFAAGILCGWVALHKFTLVLPCLLGLWWLDRTPRRVLLTALGAALPLLLALAYLHRIGAWDAYVEIQRWFVAPYARFAQDGETAWTRARAGTLDFAGDYWLACLLALAGAAAVAWRPDARAGLPLLAWLALALAGVAVQGKYFGYHWIPAMPPLALLAGAGLSRLYQLPLSVSGRGSGGGVNPHRRHTTPQRPTPLPCLIAILAASLIADWPSYRDGCRITLGSLPRREYNARFGRPNGGDYSYLADLDAARYVRAATRPGEGVFIWGFEPLVYVLAERRPPTRFHFAVPLVSPGTPDSWRRELLRDLTARPPRLFLVLRNDAIPWASGRADDSEAQLRQFTELHRFLQRHYRFERRIEDFAVYRHIGERAGDRGVTSARRAKITKEYDRA
jgi:hypothetical protein